MFLGLSSSGDKEPLSVGNHSFITCLFSTTTRLLSDAWMSTVSSPTSSACCSGTSFSPFSMFAFINDIQISKSVSSEWDAPDAATKKSSHQAEQKHVIVTPKGCDCKQTRKIHSRSIDEHNLCPAHNKNCYSAPTNPGSEVHNVACYWNRTTEMRLLHSHNCKRIREDCWISGLLLSSGSFWLKKDRNKAKFTL